MLAQAKDLWVLVWFAHTDEYTLYKRLIEGDTTLGIRIPSSAGAGARQPDGFAHRFL